MSNPHLLPNNLARQQYRYTSVPLHQKSRQILNTVPPAGRSRIGPGRSNRFVDHIFYKEIWSLNCSAGRGFMGPGLRFEPGPRKHIYRNICGHLWSRKMSRQDLQRTSPLILTTGSSLSPYLSHGIEQYIHFFKYFLGDFFLFFVLYSTLLHLPPLSFHCADGCWD